VRVQIDESWGDEFARNVDDALRIARHRRFDGDDLAALDGHVARITPTL
jgi:hypothetical protein